MRPTEIYPRAWIAHHQLQYGRNWHYVAWKFLGKESPMRK